MWYRHETWAENYRFVVSFCCCEVELNECEIFEWSSYLSPSHFFLEFISQDIFKANEYPLVTVNNKQICVIMNLRFEWPLASAHKCKKSHRSTLKNLRWRPHKIALQFATCNLQPAGKLWACAREPINTNGHWPLVCVLQVKFNYDKQTNGRLANWLA